MLRPVVPENKTNWSPYKEIYSFGAFSYLDSEEAYPLFAKQADIIMSRGYKGIVDVGCRVGRINEILQERGYEDYNFMGFDTSPEPIEWAKDRWKSHDNIEYRVANWNDHDSILVDFEVDCVLFSGVLCYLPKTHWELFQTLVVDLYDADGAIVQDLRNDQPNTDDRIKANYVYSDIQGYSNCYRSVSEHKIDCEFYYGNRSVFDIRIYED